MSGKRAGEAEAETNADGAVSRRAKQPVFIRRVFEGKYAARVTSKLGPKSISATVPDLYRVSARGGAREETPYGNILVLAAAVYMVIARSDAEY